MIPYFISLCSGWFIFFKLNFYSITRRILSNDKLNKRNLFKGVNNKFFIYNILIYNFFLLMSFFVIRGNFYTFWWEHLQLSNINLNVLIFISILLILCFYLLFNFSTAAKKINYNFFFATLNASICLTLIFLANTFFTFFFLLELSSLILFYKLSSSRFRFKTGNIISTSEKLAQLNSTAKSYLNMLFFTYWTTFFSSVLFVYCLLLLSYYFGSTEWTIINLLLQSATEITFTNSKNCMLYIAIIVILSFFLKTGLTPFHLYKIELYKGITFTAIFFYNTFYFFIYFLYFVFLVYYHLYELFIIYSTINYYIFFVATIYNSTNSVKKKFNRGIDRS